MLQLRASASPFRVVARLRTAVPLPQLATARRITASTLWRQTTSAFDDASGQLTAQASAKEDRSSVPAHPERPVRRTNEPSLPASEIPPEMLAQMYVVTPIHTPPDSWFFSDVAGGRQQPEQRPAYLTRHFGFATYKGSVLFHLACLSHIRSHSFGAKALMELDPASNTVRLSLPLFMGIDRTSSSPRASIQARHDLRCILDEEKSVAGNGTDLAQRKEQAIEAVAGLIVTNGLPLSCVHALTFADDRYRARRPPASDNRLAGILSSQRTAREPRRRSTGPSTTLREKTDRPAADPLNTDQQSEAERDITDRVPVFVPSREDPASSAAPLRSQPSDAEEGGSGDLADRIPFPVSSPSEMGVPAGSHGDQKDQDQREADDPSLPEAGTFVGPEGDRK